MEEYGNSLPDFALLLLGYRWMLRTILLGSDGS